MSKTPAKSLPPDHLERLRALDPSRSFLVQAPAGSGKTDLLTRRFLRLLAEVDDPGQILAITFTNAAAAEMRNRILGKLESASGNARPLDTDPFSTEVLARQALKHSKTLGWNLLDLPAQLRIKTIDSFCRDLALQQPLLSGLGGGLAIADPATELYRRAARLSLEKVDEADPALKEALSELLLWRDNNWKDMEDLLVEMLKNRGRWMHDFIFDTAQDGEALRKRLERPFALAAVSSLSPARFTDDEWKIVRACFTLLRRAVAELHVVFAEAAAVDYTEVAQIAQRVLKGAEGLPTDAAMAVSDGIRHLLIDEFQDTSRLQHELLRRLITAWPDRTGRTCFVVGDPMQSIYFFRQADAELFPRVKAFGLEIPNDEPFLFDSVSLRANFRTTPSLVGRLNEVFDKIFALPDGSGVTFSSAGPMREEKSSPGPSFTLHLDFVPHTGPGKTANPESKCEMEDAHKKQVDEIVDLIRNQMSRIDEAKANKEKYRVAVLARARKSLVPIAQVLREAQIPFRAVDLEKLAARPEVLDALALARALLNPHDRIAWLGLLRAPWCGLALDDLHLLTSADDPELLARPISELLVERPPLLSAAGQRTVHRVLEALDAAPQQRADLPTASIGTWLQQIWLRLGGAQCVDRTACANLDLLWSSLDQLPAGEQDLLGPAIDAALDKLTAQPDPAVSSDCGVQLMTIHKAKGLEFEVVIVPDLQAGSSRGKVKMLSWLERGLAQPDDSGEITEFLIAPFQPKGAVRGEAKAWVDRVYRDREKQEDRRILYVAATRAREKLHLFARPSYKTERDGTLSLSALPDSLLTTAWPALEDEIRARFEEWKTSRAVSQSNQDQEIESIAASGESNLLVMPSLAKPTILRRLPPDFQPVAPQILGAPSFPRLSAERVGKYEYSRHEGGLLSRALGTAVHTLLEELSRLRATTGWEAAREALSRLEPRIAAQVRASGLDQTHAAQIAAQALHQARNASRDPIGQWILSPHTEAASEVRWAGVVSGSLRTVQVDRVFRAGPAPKSEGKDCWWIIDYKTAHADNADPATVLPKLRPLFAPQLEAYAEVLRNLHGKDSHLCAGLYYPRMLLLDWWEL